VKYVGKGAGLNRALVVTAVVMFGVTGVITAGSNSDHKVAIHVLSHEDRTCTSNFPDFVTCGDVTQTFAGCGDIDVFPVFFDLVAVTSLDYGLTWPISWGSCVFTVCAGDLRIGDIVSPGDGIAHAWIDCQYEWAITPGYAWLYADGPGKICPVANPTTGDLTVVDCDRETDQPMETFCAGVCGKPGDDPCGGSPPEDPTTWGTIKSIFR
jgi:hypothetical protein